MDGRCALSQIDTPMPAADHQSLYDEYEVKSSEGVVLFCGPLWAALLYMRLEVESHMRRRLIPTKKGGA